MKSKYDTLENEYKNTAKELASITGWTPQQAEKVLALVAGFSKDYLTLSLSLPNSP